MSFVSDQVLMFVGVAVMYLFLMRYSYACEDGFWLIHDQEPRA